MSRRTQILVIVLTAMIVLAGCAGMESGGDAGGGGDGGAEDAAGPQLEADDGAEMRVSQQSATNVQNGESGSDVPDVQEADRAIIREGTMVVEVDDFETARDGITTRANELGGFVGESSQQLHRDGDRERRTGYVVVRVPADEYETMQEAVSAEGTVVDERTETTDVSDQLVDLEARIDNLEQRRDRLRTFYDRANSTDELLQIERELSEVQGEIERLEAKQRSLERRVAYSTLRIEIREPGPGESVQTQYHEQSLVAVFLASVEDVITLARATLVTAAVAAPWALVVAAPVVGLYWTVRRRLFPIFGSAESTDDDSSSDAEEALVDETDESGPGDEPAAEDDGGPSEDTRGDESEGPGGGSE